MRMCINELAVVICTATDFLERDEINCKLKRNRRRSLYEEKKNGTFETVLSSRRRGLGKTWAASKFYYILLGLGPAFALSRLQIYRWFKNSERAWRAKVKKIIWNLGTIFYQPCCQVVSSKRLSGSGSRLKALVSIGFESFEENRSRNFVATKNLIDF